MRSNGRFVNGVGGRKLSQPTPTGWMTIMGRETGVAETQNDF